MRTPRTRSDPKSSFAHSVLQAGSLHTACDRHGAPSPHKDSTVGEPLSFLRKSGHSSHVMEEGTVFWPGEIKVGFMEEETSGEDPRVLSCTL